MLLTKRQITPLIITIALLCVSASGCLENSSNNKIGVIVTIAPMTELVEIIGNEYIDTITMVPTGESPHSFELTPKQMAQVSTASAYFKVGSGVEFELLHMTTLLEQNPHLKIFDCSKNITVLSFNEHYGQEHYHENSDNNSRQDIENHISDGTDPHIWLSPLNYKKMAETVYAGLADIDPFHQQEYFTNYQTYIEQLDNLHTNISTTLQEHTGKSFMSYHPAWGYFGDTYQLKQITIEDEGKEPGPAGIAAIIEQAQKENITVIFVAPQFSTASAKTIAEEIGGKVVLANPLMTDYIPVLYQLSLELVQGFHSTEKQNY